MTWTLIYTSRNQIRAADILFVLDWFSRFNLTSKGQYISKSNYEVPDSFKKRTKHTQDSILSEFLLWFDEKRTFYWWVEKNSISLWTILLFSRSKQPNDTFILNLNAESEDFSPRSIVFWQRSYSIYSNEESVSTVTEYFKHRSST